MRIAVTGGTGFVGHHLLRIAADRGHQIRALARRPQDAAPGVAWITGALDDAAALARLVEGAEAVIHVAGVVNVPTRDGFFAGNVTGTQAVIAAALAAGARRLVHVSSLSAREPDLSDYGWSKARSEAAVQASGLAWTIVRPPAVYGPGDREMLELFRMAKRGIVTLPPAGGRLSLIEARDLARLLLDLVPATEAIGQTYEPDDGRDGGWRHEEFARAIGDAVGRRVLPVCTPPAILRLGAWIDRLARGDRAKLTADRVRYFCHPDWVVTPAARPPATVWQPQVDTMAGLAATAAAYREAGWL